MTYSSVNAVLLAADGIRAVQRMLSDAGAADAGDKELVKELTSLQDVLAACAEALMKLHVRGAADNAVPTPEGVADPNQPANT